MPLKRETQGEFCVLNANAKSQTQKSMKINVICTVVCIVIYFIIAVILRNALFTGSDRICMHFLHVIHMIKLLNMTIMHLPYFIQVESFFLKNPDPWKQM